jgi:hypothetical protein
MEKKRKIFGKIGKIFPFFLLFTLKMTINRPFSPKRKTRFRQLRKSVELFAKVTYPVIPTKAVRLGRDRIA